MKRYLLILLLAAGLQAGVYYIDFASGADTNNGTAKGTPWKHAPGMQGCTSNCASTTPAADDNFIFKGGVTWDQTCFQWIPVGSGSSGHPIYYGVDQTWYNGGLWSRPVFNANYQSNLPGTPGNNSVIYVNNRNWLTFDNLEVTGLMAAQNFGPGLFFIGSASGIIVQNCYLHGWDLVGSVTTDDAHGGVIANNTPGPLTVANCTIENSYKTGSGRQQGLAIRGVENIYGTTFHDLSSCMLGVGGGVIHDNVMYNIGWTPIGDHSGNLGFDPEYHHNLMYVNTSSYVYNNLFYNINMPTNYYLEPCDSGGIDGTIYAFNNVGIGNTGLGAALFNLDAEGGGSPSCGTWYLYNNTLEVDDGIGQQTLIYTMHPYKLKNVIVRNSHLIFDTAYPPSCDAVAETCINDYYVKQTQAVAISQGYTFESKYAPTSANGASVDVGTNLTSLCTGSLAPLCYDRLGMARPPTGPWDAGAYEYGVGGSRMSGKVTSGGAVESR